MTNFQLDKNVPVPSEEAPEAVTALKATNQWRHSALRRRMNIPFRQQIISFVIRHPGLSKTAYSEKMGVNQSSFAFVSKQLVAEGVLVEKELGRHTCLWFFDKEVQKAFTGEQKLAWRTPPVVEEEPLEDTPLEAAIKKSDGRATKRGPRGPYKAKHMKLTRRKPSLWQRLTGRK